MSEIIAAIICPPIVVLLVGLGCCLWGSSYHRRRNKRFEESGLPAKIRKSSTHDSLKAALGRDFNDRVRKSTADVLASHKRSELEGFRGDVWMTHHTTAAGVLEHCRIFAHEHMFEVRPRRPDDASKLEAGDSVLEYTSEPRTFREERQQRILAAAAAVATAPEAPNSRSHQGQEDANAAVAAAGMLLAGKPRRPTADGIDTLVRSVVGSFEDGRSREGKEQKWDHLVRKIVAGVIERPNRPNYESIVGSHSTDYHSGTTLVDRAVRSNVWVSHAEGLRSSTAPSEHDALCAAIAKAEAFGKNMAEQYERAGVDLHLATDQDGQDRTRHVYYWFKDPPKRSSPRSTTGNGPGGGGGGGGGGGCGSGGGSCGC